LRAADGTAHQSFCRSETNVSPTRARISAFIAVAVFGLALCAGHADAQEVYNSTSRLDIISEEVAGPAQVLNNQTKGD
jgi:hypothetical protein